MVRVLGFCFKIIPSIYYIIQLNLFIRDTVSNISQFWKNIFMYGVPSVIILCFLLYIFVFRDIFERQISKEQDENESRLFTVKIQTARMFRKYIPTLIIGILVALLFYFYKPHIILISIKVFILYMWFLLGEIFRIIDIGTQDNLRNNEKLGYTTKEKEASK